MPTLQVRELPEDVYHKLQRLAEAENRSLAQETIVLLRKALGIEGSHVERRRAILAMLQTHHPPKIPASLSAEQLIREDRDR